MHRATVIIGPSARPAAAFPGPADRAALELAVTRFPAAPKVLCTMADEPALRYALAAGAAQADLLSDPGDVVGPWVLVGPGSLAVYGDWLPAAMAERISAALVFEACDISNVSPDELIVLRDLGSGNRDELAIKAPAVIVLSAATAPRRYVSRYRQRQASVPPPANGRGIRVPWSARTSAWEPMRPRTPSTDPGLALMKCAEERASMMFGLEAQAPSTSSAGEPIQADPATCAAHLLRYLQHHQLLPASVNVAWPEAPASQSPVSAARSPATRQATTGIETISTRAPRRISELAGHRHRRQPRPVRGCDNIAFAAAGTVAVSPREGR
ncbi:MAG: hypothetical protein ACT4QC_10815 [Planctomycetaceae bacterium]